MAPALAGPATEPDEPPVLGASPGTSLARAFFLSSAHISMYCLEIFFRSTHCMDFHQAVSMYGGRVDFLQAGVVCLLSLSFKSDF